MMKPTGELCPKFRGEYTLGSPVGPGAAAMAEDLATSISRAQEGICLVGGQQGCHIEGVITALPREVSPAEDIPPARVKVEASCGCIAIQGATEPPVTTPRNLVRAVGIFEDKHHPVYASLKDAPR